MTFRNSLRIAVIPIGMFVASSIPALAAHAHAHEHGSAMAHATLLDAQGASRGSVQVMAKDGGLNVTVAATGLTPGVHGLHIHTVGQCTAPDFASAGGHWNPMAKHHGMENPDGAHMGDLPNITIGADGSGSLTFTAISGRPIEVLGAHPAYGPSEVFILPRGSGGRTPTITQTDLHIGYDHLLTERE